jgi:hypothetical protein
VPILSHINPIHIIPFYLSKINFDIVHAPTSWSSQWSLSFWLSLEYWTINNHKNFQYSLLPLAASIILPLDVLHPLMFFAGTLAYLQRNSFP